MKTIKLFKVRRGSLEIFESINGFYLYGLTPELVTVFLGSLGDGVDEDMTLDPNDNADELSEAYRFELVEVHND